jgi:ABC-type nickel/cobalt efflux system permease component RcnA
MKDIIWTIIIVWLIYKVIELFKSATVKRSYAHHSQGGEQQETHQNHTKGSGHAHKDIKEAVRQHINKTGEYVDFEEIK